MSAAGAASVFGQQAQGTGTGFIIDTRGYIVTNNHVVTLGGSREASKITIDLADGTTLDATIVGRDERSDIAVLKVNTDASKLQTLSFASADSIQVGEDVVAIGFPLNLIGEPTVTRGVISAVDRTINETIQGVGAIEIAGAIQTDAAINPGNSGGPLLDADGRVVGINTAGLRGGASEIVTGINFAVSSPVAQPIVSSLIDTGTVRRGFLGVSIASVDRDVAQARKLAVNSGAIVTNVTRDTAADKAGMRANDVIVKIGDQPIGGVGDVTRALTKYGPGQTVKVEFYRGSDKQTTDLTLQDRPSS